MTFCVLIIKALPKRYCSNFCTAKTTTSNSFSYIDTFSQFGPNSLLMMAIGCLFYCMKTPMPILKVSISISKLSSKYGNAKIGAVVTAPFKAWKAIVASSLQT